MPNKKTIEPVEEVVTGADEAVEETQELVEKMIAKGVADVSAKLEASFEAKLAEHKELMEKKAGIYSPEAKSDRGTLNTKIRSTLKAMRYGDFATLKSLGTTDDANGGYLVDSELASEIQRLATEYGIARREMRVETLSKNSLEIPTALTDLSVFWTDERGVKSSSQPTFSRPELTLKKITSIIPLTDELLEDTEFDLFRYISDVVAEKMAQKEDLAFFCGDGSATYGSFTGLLNNTSVNEVVLTGSTFASVTADDLLDMIDETHPGAISTGKFYGHRTIMSVLRQLKASTAGTYVYQAPSEKGPETVWGYPFVRVEAMPSISDSAEGTSFLLFGDLRKASWIGVKAGGMSMAIAKEATISNTANNGDIDLFRQDMTALRFVERIGYVVVLPKAVTKLTTASASA
jgi:HK97 family phage major capsid protein